MPKKIKKVHPVTKYAQDIVKCKIIANKWVILACKRHLNDLKRRDIHFDEAAANHIFEFFEDWLFFYEGDWDGKPFLLTPNQKFIIGSIFGWKRKDGLRRFRTAYIEMGKGNGKSPLAAGIGLYGLTFDDEAGAEIYAAATQRDQAGILFRDARLYAEGSESLKEMLIIDRHNIANPETNSFFRPVSSEHKGLDGKKPHMAMIDEIHEHPNDLVVRKMSAGAKTRRQNLTFEITNALSLDTKIPTPEGWTTMGNIQVGDQVFNDKGNICNVEAVTDVMFEHDCYKVIFDDGSEIIADAGHLWETDDTKSRACYGWSIRTNKKTKAKPHILTTSEMFNTQKNFQGYNNYSIKNSLPIRSSYKNLIVDPYVLGVWLSDGIINLGEIAQGQKDIDFLRREFKKVGYKITKLKNKDKFGTIGLATDLRKIDVLNNKHIPKIYLRGSIEQRLSLLQGLLDGDGSIPYKDCNTVTFDNTNKKISTELCELICSLGMNARFYILKRKTTTGKKVYRTTFLPTMPVFRYPRKLKQIKKRAQKARSYNRYIKTTIPVESVPVKCISVDSKSHLFLVGKSMIPTHNSGYDRHSICYQHHEYTEKILEGTIKDDSWFGLMTGLDVCEKCEAEGKTIPQDGCPDCDDWRDSKCWIKANPNLPYLGKPFKDYLRRQVAEAKAMPSQENIVKRLNFCCWTESITKWLPIDKWNACNFPVDPEALKGRTCYGGLDLSSNIDLTAWVMVFPPEEEGGLYEILCRFFLPEDNMMERVKRDKVPYDVWARQGYIKLTPGNIIDYAFIIAQIEQDMTDYHIAELAFDRWGSQKITTDLQDLGFEIEGKRSLIQFGQGFASMSPPTKEVETMVLKGNLAHGGNPVLAWCVSNVAIRTDPAENKKPDKEKSIERIDGAVALVMAIGRAMLRGGQEKSQYEGMSVEAIKERMSI